jgi:DNA-binding IclR family transcriptional regulator
MAMARGAGENRCMTSVPVRSVVRALDLLEALNRQAVSTLDTLHAQTRIPKSTLVRLLQTFEGRGFIRHAPQHGAYLLAEGVRSLSSGYHGEPVRRLLARVRDAGYALRDTQVVPSTNTLAVPVFDAHGVAAAVGLTFFASTMRPEAAVERFLPELQALARAIGARLKGLQQ